jgi:DNA-binding NarL/FixJ family response regulator
VIEARCEDHSRPIISGRERPGNVDSIDGWQLHIEENDIWAEGAGELQRLGSVRGLTDDPERGAESLARDCAECRAVVYEQQGHHPTSVPFAVSFRCTASYTLFWAASAARMVCVMKVVVADDSVLLREGTARVLTEHGFDVVGQAGDADELLLKVRSYSPDVAIVDIRMPPTHTNEGLVAAKEIRRLHPGVGVLVLSQYVETDYATELLAEDAAGVGYLLKDRVADIAEFVAAVRRVAEGGSALDPSIVSRLLGRSRRDNPIDTLTPREREVLELMAEGLSNAAIAARLVVTERAIEKHVTSIFGKLRLPPDADAHRRVLAVVAFLRDT